MRLTEHRAWRMRTRARPRGSPITRGTCSVLPAAAVVEAEVAQEAAAAEVEAVERWRRRWRAAPGVVAVVAVVHPPE